MKEIVSVTLGSSESFQEMTHELSLDEIARRANTTTAVLSEILGQAQQFAHFAAPAPTVASQEGAEGRTSCVYWIVATTDEEDEDPGFFMD